MAKSKVTKAALKAALIKDLKQVAGSKKSITRHEYLQASALGKRYESVYRTFAEFSEAAGLEAAGQQSESHVIEDDKLTITLPKTSISTFEELATRFKIDPKVWEVARFNATYSNVDESAPYRVVAFLRKRKDIIAIQEEIESLKNLAKASARKPLPIERPSKPSGNMLEITIADQHFGKLAWDKETGHEPYDTKIAQSMFFRALNTLLDRTAGYKFDSVLFVVGNDLFNSDNVAGTTTKGTYVDTDARYQKTFEVVRNTIVESIEKLRKIAPVKVTMCSGNHDQLAVWHLGVSLDSYFHNYTDVVVENTPRTRKYHRFGKVLLMFTHGNEGKREDYPLLMATERSADFGETKFREVHTGHNHTTKTQEFHGVRVRIIPSLSPADAWHSAQGYTGNLRTAEAYVWNENEGLLSVHYYNDDAQPGLSTVSEVVAG